MQYRSFAAGLALSLLTVVPIGMAQAPASIAVEPLSATEDSRTQDASTLDEVVVTASRRVQNILKVPVAVSEVDGGRLLTGTIRDALSLQMEIPSLGVTTSGNDYSGANIRIRGVGTSGSNAGFEGSVGVFVDGVYLSRPGLAINDLVDIDRIEVLRGPQGTLFGKNTSVGAINIYTKKPSNLREAQLSASVGNFGGRVAGLMLNTPLGEGSTALRLSAQHHQRDGFIENLFDGESYNNRDRTLLRAQASFEPSINTALRLIVDHVDKDERCCATPYTLNGRTAQNTRDLGGTVFEPPSDDTVAFDALTESTARETGMTAILDWDLAGAALRAQLSTRDTRAGEPTDGDKSDLDVSYLPFQDSTTRSHTAEVSLNGRADWYELDWLVGAYYSQEDIGLSASTLLGEDAAAFLVASGAVAEENAALYPAGSGQTLTRADQSGESVSLFTHNIFQLPGRFDLTLGARLLKETKDGGGVTESNSPSCTSEATTPRLLCAAPAYRVSYDDDRITGTAALGRSFDSGLYLYGSYSSGFKAGGINLNPPSTTSGKFTFDPESVDAFELGAKVPLLDSRLQARAAVFHMDFEDFQLNTFDGLSFTVSNAAEVRSRGMELELTYTGFEHLRLRGAGTYSDTTYGAATRDANLRGKQLTNAPEWTGQLGADYQRALPFWQADFVGNIVARYQSEVNTGADLDPLKRQAGYTLVNTRLGLRLPGELEVSLWGVNLTDESYKLVIFNSPAQAGSRNGSFGAPRTYGLELRKNF